MNEKTKKCGQTVILAGLVSVGLALGAQASEVSFTEAQATRGSAAFQTNCSGCHSMEMVDSFRHYPNAALFHGFMSAEMPMDNPGGLSPQVYMDIVAFLMHEAGFAAGEEELKPTDRAALEAVVPATTH